MTPFNINNTVKVKLTSTGIEVLKLSHEELQKKFPLLSNFVVPDTDSNGYSTWQLLELISCFGPTINVRNPPFHSDILINT